MKLALKGLLVKEWRMMKGFLIGLYILAIVLVLVSSVFEGLVALMVGSSIIIPATILFSLNTEVNQMQSFLHLPRSAHMLLLAKLIYSIVITVVFLLIVSAFLTSYEYLLDTTSQNILETFTFLISVSFHGIIISLYPFAIVLFLWTLHQIWRTYLGSGISIVLIVITLVAGSYIIEFLLSFQIIQAITKWNMFPVKDNLHTDLDLEFLTAFPPLGAYLFYGLIAIILYLIATYLLDHKVEAS